MSNALADLGASISVMPYSLFERLGLGSLKPIKMTIEMADRSMKSPKGIKENISLRVGQDQVVFKINKKESLASISPICVINEFDKTQEYGNLVRMNKKEVWNFKSYLSPEYGSQDIISLSPSKSAEINEDSSMTLCDPDKRMSIGLEDFVDIDDM
ncbi:putative reverse transcriptase, RNA-dependent DNA polymerase [Tanacetum coccineum]